jgi:hypothetical protein
VTRLSGMMKLERDKVFWYDASSWKANFSAG